MKKLGLYLRVSTTDQAGEDRYSIPVQREQGKKFAEENGFVYEVFEDHKSGSGTLERAGYQGLLRKIESGEIDGIWISRFDRFSRDTSDGLAAIKVLRKMNCRFWVASVEYDIFNINTELMITMVFAFADYERKQILARTTAGKKKARDEGNRIVVDMLGWDRYVGPDGMRAVRVNQEEARVVKFIYDEFLSGQTITQIRHKLLDAGFRGKFDGRVIHNEDGEAIPLENSWNYATIKRTLQHPEHTGLTYNALRTELIESKKYTEQIIPRDDWQRVQKMFGPKAYETDRVTGWRIVTYFGSGLLTCEKCGAKYYFLPVNSRKRKDNTSKRFSYYQHKKLTPAHRACTSTAMILPLKDVEDYLEVLYLDFFSDPESLKELYDASVKDIVRESDELEMEEKRIGKELAENRRKAANYLRAIEAGIELSEIKTETDRLNVERAKLENDLAERRREYSMKTESREDLLDMFSIENIKTFLGADGATKRSMVKKIFKSVSVTDYIELNDYNKITGVWGRGKFLRVEYAIGDRGWCMNLEKPIPFWADQAKELREGTLFSIEEILARRKTWEEADTELDGVPNDDEDDGKSWWVAKYAKNLARVREGRTE